MFFCFPTFYTFYTLVVLYYNLLYNFEHFTKHLIISHTIQGSLLYPSDFYYTYFCFAALNQIIKTKHCISSMYMYLMCQHNLRFKLKEFGPWKNLQSL